jgi:hypothetical protein
VSDTHKYILERIAEPSLKNADIHLSTKVTGIENRDELPLEGGADPKVSVTTTKGVFEFDEVICTVPLGCLKENTPSFKPALPPRITRAIRNASYSSLEKVYIAFPRAFWDGPTPKDSPWPTEPKTASPPEEHAKPFPSFAHFIHPDYTLSADQKSWALELVPLSNPAVFGPTARPVLLFYTFGPSAAHITSLIRDKDRSSPEYTRTLDEIFRPFYSRLPGFAVDDQDCTPSGYLATDWLGDELSGRGSYTNFKVSAEPKEEEGEILLDEDVRAVRAGMPERGIWFGGEHTAPFVALGTSTGAYWSGEMAAVKVLAANGLLSNGEPEEDA